MQQYAALVDYLIYREFKHEGWNPLAILFYPGLMSNEKSINKILSHNGAQEKDNEDTIQKNSAMLKNLNNNEENASILLRDAETSKKNCKIPM